MPLSCVVRDGAPLVVQREAGHMTCRGQSGCTDAYRLSKGDPAWSHYNRSFLTHTRIEPLP